MFLSMSFLNRTTEDTENFLEKKLCALFAFSLPFVVIFLTESKGSPLQKKTEPQSSQRLHREHVGFFSKIWRSLFVS